MRKVLLIDDDRNILTTLEIYLRGSGYLPVTAGTGVQGIEKFSREKPEIVFLDLKLPDMDGLQVLDEILLRGEKTYVVMVTAFAAIDTAVKAIKKGAHDYLPKPFTPAQVSNILSKIDKLRDLELQIETLKGIIHEGDFITRSPRMRKILGTARQVADTNAGVLITGESGTGKGILARLIHDWSIRAERAFVTVNCAGLQENLLESDLFGHIRGAFTGALKDKTGKLELADGGTVFLDEVSEMSASSQAKFLHFLQDHAFERLGDPHPRQVDVRVIAAANRDLEEMVRDKIFRQDLYFRLNVVELFVPPLRERPEDIHILAEYYLERFSRLNKKNIREIGDEALALLQNYPWPGNIRELVNVIERGTILARNVRLIPDDLPSHIAQYAPRKPSDDELASLVELEKAHIQKVLLNTPSLEEAARILGIDPATLWRKRKKYQLD